VLKNHGFCPNIKIFSKQNDNSCTTHGFGYTPSESWAGTKCNNLLQNPSFEAALAGWETDNVRVTDDTPVEGTQVASLGPGVASMFQDIPLNNRTPSPLFLSFNVYPNSNSSGGGNLIAEVSWLDANHHTIASGLRLFIPGPRIISNARISYFDVTDCPPAGAAWARLQFSKGLGSAPDLLAIDQIILTPVGTSNLVQNPSFELGLTAWTTTTFAPSFQLAYEGLAQVTTTADGTILQDVPIDSLPTKSPFLLGFAVNASLNSNFSLSVQVLWLNETNTVIGTPGLDLFIPPLTLPIQGNYLAYLDITEPAPIGAVKARIQFTVDTLQASQFGLDQVILVATRTTNLVQNPSFKNGFANWTPVNTLVESTNEAYEGTEVAVVAQNGGVLFQDVPLADASGHCFLFNCGLGYTGTRFPNGNMLIKIYWLDKSGYQIGLGLSLVIPLFILNTEQWLIYSGITEAAPPGTMTARVQFTKSSGGTGGAISIDKVVLARLV